MESISSKQKQQYDVLLGAYRKHNQKGPVVLFFFLVFFFGIVYLVSVASGETNVSLILFGIAVLAGIALLIYITILIKENIAKIDKDIEEGAYEKRLDKLRFINSGSTNSKYSKELNLQSRKKSVVILLSNNLKTDKFYWFTFAVHSDVIVDVHAANETVDFTDENIQLRNEPEPILKQEKKQISNDDLVPLEDDEMRYFQKSEIAGTLFMSTFIGAFPGLFSGIFLANYCRDNFGTPEWPVMLGSVIFFSALLFFFIYRSMLRTKNKVLKNPVKKIISSTIQEVKEYSNSDRTYYRIFFVATDKKKKQLSIDRLKSDQMNRITQYAGSLMLHIEVNEKQLLKVTGEDGELFYSVV